MRLCRTISSVKKLHVMLNLITSALGWKTIFRKQMFNKIFWDGSINVIFFKGSRWWRRARSSSRCRRRSWGSSSPASAGATRPCAIDWVGGRYHDSGPSPLARPNGRRRPGRPRRLPCPTSPKSSSQWLEPTVTKNYVNASIPKE